MHVFPPQILIRQREVGRVETALDQQIVKSPHAHARFARAEVPDLDEFCFQIRPERSDSIEHRSPREHAGNQRRGLHGLAGNLDRLLRRVFTELAHVAEHQVERCIGIERGLLQAQAFGKPKIVRIKKRQQVAFALPNPKIASGARPLVRLGEIGDARLISLDYSRCTVRRAVVDHHDFIGRHGLAENAVDRLGDIWRSVKNRDDDAGSFPGRAGGRVGLRCAGTAICGRRMGPAHLAAYVVNRIEQQHLSDIVELGERGTRVSRRQRCCIRNIAYRPDNI